MTDVEDYPSNINIKLGTISLWEIY